MTRTPDSRTGATRAAARPVPAWRAATRRPSRLARHARRGLPLLVAALAGATACTRVREGVRAAVDGPASPHERYAASLRDAGLATTALGREWLAAADTVLGAAHAVALPHREAGAYVRDEARAAGWRVALREGERLVARVVVRGEPGRVFVDAFEVEGDSVPRFRHRASAVADSSGDTLVLRLEADRTAPHVIRLQPELLRRGRYELELRAEPTLAFPVPAVGPAAVQSFWGAARDAGARRHEGIDIFAPRGTPVVAVADGTVRSTAPNRLGGLVVWLADDGRAQALYYAHLDTVLVREGMRVRTGDTLGRVGNTGNAASTRPHLHFGIYRAARGPVDPWPFVRPVREAAARVTADTALLGAWGVARVAGTLRAGPATAAAVTARVAARDTLRIVGAAGRWYRVQRGDGTAGFTDVAVTRLAMPTAVR